MILNLSFFYQIIFNSLHFMLMMPFIISEQHLKVSVLYICATLPSFLLTVPINKIVARHPINKVIVMSIILCLCSAIVLLKYSSFSIVAFILFIRSTVGCVFVPKIAQFVGSQQQKQYSIFILQLILFLPGIIGYGLALCFYKFELVYIILSLECTTVLALIFSFRKKSHSFQNNTSFIKNHFIFDVVILYETILITLITFISLFHISSLLKLLQTMSINYVLIITFVQLVFLFLIRKNIKHQSMTFLFLNIIFLALILFSGHHLSVIIIPLFIYLLINFFMKTQHYWHNVIDFDQQSYFFSQRLVITNTPKFLICLIPTIDYLI